MAGTRLFDEAEAAAKDSPVALDQVQRARLALEYVQLCRSAPGKPAPGGPTHAGARPHRHGQARPLRHQLSVRKGEPVAHFLKRIGKAANTSRCQEQ